MLCCLALSVILTSSRFAGAAPAPGPLNRFTYTQYHMGVDARLVVYAAGKTAAEDACGAAFARIAALDTIMSDYRRDSELTRLSARAGGPPVRVSPDLFTVLRRAQEVSRASSGAFDVTVGPLVALWRKARKTGVLPTPADLEAARHLVGWHKLRLDERARTVRLTLPGMKLDLGGIAKGYAADEAQRVLKKHGITSALVELGGDIVVSGPPPGTGGWTIRVPNAGSETQPADLRFANRAISTSGDTEQSTVIGGKRYSHVVDPRTGQALTNRIQVTLTAADGLTSDPLATALGVLGGDRERLLRAFPGTVAHVRVLPGTTSGVAAGDAEGWKPLFDGKSLAGWKATDFAGGGEVRVDPNFRGGPPAIVVDAGARLSGLNWTGEVPRTNYELTLESMKIEGHDFHCALTFPVGDSHATLVLGGWGGTVVGISSIDDQDASESQSRRYADFPTDRWFRVRLRVTPAKIEAWLDDKQIVDEEITGRKVSLRPGDISRQIPLGLATYQTSAAYRNIRIRTVHP
jgi:thiamine biosynthesis lipoprotein